MAYDIFGVKVYKNLNSVLRVNEAIKILNMEDTDKLFDDNTRNFLKRHTWDNVALHYKEIFDKYADRHRF